MITRSRGRKRKKCRKIQMGGDEWEKKEEHTKRLRGEEEK